MSFAKGDAAMAMIYAHHASNFVVAQRENARMDIGFAPVPGGRPLLAGGSLAILKQSSNPHDAYTFITWATGEHIAPELVMQGGTSACSIVFQHREILDTYPWLDMMPEVLRQGTRRPILSISKSGFSQRDFEHTLGEHLYQAICGYIEPQEAMKRVQRFVDKIN